MKRFKKILITGSSGMIGTRLFENLLGQGFDVVGFDKRPNTWSFEFNKRTIKGNLTRQGDIQKLSGGIDLIIHLAANARVYDLVVNPDLALENIVSTYNTLEFARKNKIKSFIFSSSREVYSNKPRIVSAEKDVDIHLCESPYTASKMSGEALVYAFSRCYGIDSVVVRFSNVYGMYDTTDRFIPLLIGQMQRNQNVYIYGKDKLLDFTYIDDCIDGVVRTMERFEKVKKETFNIASGKGEKLTDVAQILRRLLNSKSKIIIKSNRTGEIVSYVADIAKAKKLLGYTPQHSLEKGLEATIDWYLSPKRPSPL